MVFCDQLATNTKIKLSNLVYEPDRQLQNILNEFIQNNVFNYAEDG